MSFLSGSLVKLTDDIEDKNIIPKLYAIPCGIAYGFSMVYSMLTNMDAYVLFEGIILGCLITGKINSMGHYVGIGIILIMLFLYGIKFFPLILPIAVLAALDEIVDIIYIPRSLEFIFEYRLITKLGILAFVIFKIIGLNALVVLLTFDAAYMLIDRTIRRVSYEI